MSQIEFFHYEAFTDTPGMGNPAGIVFDPEGMLAEEEMQRIAAAVGFNETAFVLPSGREECSLRLRFLHPAAKCRSAGTAPSRPSALWQRGTDFEAIGASWPKHRPARCPSIGWAKPGRS